MLKAKDILELFFEISLHGIISFLLKIGKFSELTRGSCEKIQTLLVFQPLRQQSRALREKFPRWTNQLSYLRLFKQTWDM